MPLDFDTFISKEVYDKAAYMGSRLRGVDKSTIANIISTFQSVEDPHEAALLTMMYIRRQAGRREIPEWISRELISHLREIYNSFKDDKRKLKDAINKYLILVKWVFDSGVKVDLKNFDEFLDYSVGKK